MSGAKQPDDHRSAGRTPGECSAGDSSSSDRPWRRNGVSAIGVLAALAVLALAVAAVAPAVTADSHDNGTGPYVIEQGDQCVDVDPVVNESQSVVDFYDYRYPNSTPNTTTYSSHGTTPYQADNTSILMLYRGSEGTSLVVIHEAFHEPASEGTNGSSATFTVTGLSPEDDGWVVEDDDYPAQDDQFEHYETYSEMDWVWGQSRTDGAAYRGLDGDVEIGIDPAFNESADMRYTGHYAGYVHDWQVVTATDDGFERVSLDSLSRDVTVRDGYCAAPPNASLAVSNATPEVGETTVALDASNSTSSTDVAEYRWDLAGNASPERVTDDPTIDHVFESTGEQDATVTVVAGDGQTDTAAVPVDVTDDTPPTAQLDAPGAATVGDEVAFSGNDSTDNHRISSYDWSLGDGTTASGAAVNHSYGSPGVYNVSLTVTDPAGHAATANATVEVTLGGPNASLAAPAAVTVNDSVTLDASGSEVAPNATYEWSVDGATVNTTNASTYETTFATAGTHDVGVVVRDDGGADSASATIDVHEPLNASVDASSTNVTAGDPVVFDATASAGNVTSYEWSFDDAEEGTNATVEHEYATPGTYEVELTVVDWRGNTDTATTTVEVAPSDDPVAAISVPDTATVNETVTLDATDSTAGPNASYEWFVDGASLDVTDAPTYETTFETTGDREVQVEVADANGSDTAMETVTVGNGSDGGEDGSGGDDGSDGDGSDDSGGGSDGGYTPVPQPEPPEPVETSVAVENGTLVVTAENVRAGEAFSVDVPANATLETAPGENGTASNATAATATDPNASRTDVVALRSVEVTPATSADTFRISFEAADRDVPGQFAASSAIVPNASADVESVHYEVAVDRPTMSASGVSADDLTAYGYDDGWNDVGTTTTVDDDRIVATAAVEGERPFGVGSVGPVLFVRDVGTAGPVTNGTVDLATTVHSTGTEPVDSTLAIRRDGARLATEPVTLAPGEETVFETTVPVPGTDDAVVTVGGQRWPLAAVTVADLTVTPSEPGPNETATVTADLANRGPAAGEVEVPLRLDGDVAAVETVSIEAGERTTVSFEQPTSAPGTYEVAVGNATATIEVSERANITDEGDGQTESAMPGFGALAALLGLALLSAGAIRRRRRYD